MKAAAIACRRKSYGWSVEVAGIDGTKGGWVAIVLGDGRFVADHVLSPVEADFSEVASAAVIAIDVPIGFGPRKGGCRSPGVAGWSGQHRFHDSVAGDSGEAVRSWTWRLRAGACAGETDLVRDGVRALGLPVS